MHSHSAYLETLLNVGIVGVLLGLARKLLERSSQRLGIWPERVIKDFDLVAVFIFALVHGLLDSNFARDGIETFIGACSRSP